MKYNPLCMNTFTPSKRDPFALFFVLFLMVMAFAVRLPAILPVHFPISDGGMFYVMAQDLRSNSYRLPAETSYNHSAIPFVYPPLGIYLPPFLADLFGWPLLQVLQYLPLVITTLTIPLFFAFASSLLHSPVKAVYAVTAYALMPATFSWTIMGGGAPRALGLLFAILTLHQAYLLYTRPRRRYWITTGICAAGVSLSHPIAAWACIYSMVLLFLFFSRRKEGLLNSLLVVLIALGVASPWLVTVLGYHGFDPFLNAGQTGHQGWFSLVDLLRFDFSEELFFKAIGAISVVGLFASLKQKEQFLPVWLILNPLIQPRGLESFTVLPLAMAFSLGMVDVILPGLGKILPASAEDRPDQISQSLRLRFEKTIQGALPKAFLALLFWQMVVNALLGAYDLTRGSLSPSDQEAMRWVAAHAPQSSRFLVLTGASHPLLDPTAEWFPALAQRQSLTTIQGQEWLIQGAWTGRVEDLISLQACLDYKIECLQDRAEGMAYTHLYVRKEPAGEINTPYTASNLLAESLSASPDYELVYTNPEISVFAFKP